MADIYSIIRVGEKPPKEILKEAKRQYTAAKKQGLVYDPECPPSTPEALAEFTAMARQLRKKHLPRVGAVIAPVPDTAPVK